MVIADFCNLYNVFVSASLSAKGMVDHAKWEHDLWTVTVYRAGGHAFVLPFKCGIGHRTKHGIPVGPSRTEVLSCLVNDATVAADGCTFDDFCNEFDYDTDSRRALDAYLGCQTAWTNLQLVFGRAGADKLIHEIEPE